MKGMFDFLLFPFKKRNQLVTYLVAERPKLRAFFSLEDGKVRFIIALCGMRLLHLNSFAQQFAPQHVANVSVDAGSGKTERLGDLSNRIRTLGQDIENFLFGAVRQEFVLRDLGPWIAVVSRPRRDAFTGKPESLETSRYTHSSSISDDVDVLARGVSTKWGNCRGGFAGRIIAA